MLPSGAVHIHHICSLLLRARPVPLQSLLLNMTDNMHNMMTGLLHIDVPIIGAPMAKASEADLCAAVARAGGLGLIGAGYMGSAVLCRTYKAAMQQLEGKDEAHSAIGIGLFNYSCSKVWMYRTCVKPGSVATCMC